VKNEKEDTEDKAESGEGKDDTDLQARGNDDKMVEEKWKGTRRRNQRNDGGGATKENAAGGGEERDGHLNGGSCGSGSDSEVCCGHCQKQTEQ